MATENTASRLHKRVWITGASAGIGRALALELARRGATVIASARRQDLLDALAADSDGLAGRVEGLAVDVTDGAATAAAIAGVEARLGPIDIAVLNAGTHEPVDLDTLKPEVFERLFALNVMGTVKALCPLVAAMRTRRAGHIAVVASVAGYRGLPTAAAYSASKAAVIAMCEALKFDLDPVGIRISVINPGFVKTPLTDKNDFKMPFLITAEDAARRMADHLENPRSFELTFPRRFTWQLKFMRLLPYVLYFPLMRRITGL